MDVYKVSPRGFCAGVRRALDIVDKTLEQYGRPIYVRHEIVHNRHIIENYESRGVVFIEKLEDVVDTSRPVIFSAHGVADEVKDKAKLMNLITVDATCPLVETVHRQIKILEKNNAEIIIIGKSSHQEIVGTIGQIKNKDKIHVVNSIEDIQSLDISYETKIGVVTQTTLSVNDTRYLMDELYKKFDNIINKSCINICYATTNRQNAVAELVKITPNIIIVGSKNSSNSTQLKNVALQCGAKQAWLIDDCSELDINKTDSCQSIGISAGASAPEYLVDELIDFLKQRYDNININDVIVMEENISFK